MQAHLAVCLLLLGLTCTGLCTDVDQDQRAIEEEILNTLFTSKMKQSQQSAPYWRVSLVNLCRLVSAEEEGEGPGLSEGAGPSLQLLEELYDLQNICRGIKSRDERLLHDSLEYLEESRDAPPKRKSPYILKRQAVHTTKSRRPYILKRNTIY